MNVVFNWREFLGLQNFNSFVRFFQSGSEFTFGYMYVHFTYATIPPGIVY